MRLSEWHWSCCRVYGDCTAMTRFLVCAAVWLALLAPAHAVLAIDGTPQVGVISGAAATTVASAAFTTTGSGDVVVALVNTTNPFGTTATVSSISGGGLTWIKRKQFTITTSNFDVGSTEIWYAIAASPLTSQVITATLSTASTGAVITVFAVSGANTTTPWDINGSLPASGSDVTGTSTVPTITSVSTTNANTVLIAYVTLPGNASGALTNPAGFTLIAQSNGFSGSPNFEGGAAQSAREIVSSTQAGISVAFSTVANWAMVVDAIQAPGGAPTAPPMRSIMGVGK